MRQIASQTGVLFSAEWGLLLAGALSGRNLLAKAHKNPDFVLERPENGGSQRQKAHKNADFVLEMPENEGFGGEKRTKTPILWVLRQI